MTPLNQILILLLLFETTTRRINCLTIVHDHLISCQTISNLDQSVFYNKYCTTTIESTYSKYFKKNVQVKYAAAHKDCFKYQSTQAILKTVYNQTLTAASVVAVNRSSSIHIFDFSPYEILTLIDFQFIQEQQQQEKEHFIVNLIARQYTTFRVINIPSNIKITLLLSGQCAIEVISSSNNENLRILSVPYFEQPSTKSSNKEFPNLISYLDKHQELLEIGSVIQLNVNILCNINSLIIHLTTTATDTASLSPLIQLNEKIEGNTIQECKIATAAAAAAATASASNKTTYLLVFQNVNVCSSAAATEAPEIRVIIKQCIYQRDYDFILFLNESSQDDSSLPRFRFIIDYPKCNLNFYSTHSVFNKFNEQLPHKKLIVDSTVGDDEVELLISALSKQYDFPSSFSYINIQNTNEFYIEFEDTTSEISPQKSNDRLRNRFEKTFFIDEHDRLKLAMNESTIQTYFKENNLNLTDFVLRNEKIWITNDALKANIFEYYDQERRRNALLTFNSENYGAGGESAFYLDKDEFFFTVNFNLERNRYGNRTKVLYLNIQPFKAIEAEMYQKHLFYFDNISNWLEYKVNRVSDEKTILENNVLNYRMRIDTQLNIIDKTIPWNVHKCWVVNTTREYSEEFFFNMDDSQESDENIEVTKIGKGDRVTVFNEDKIKYESVSNYSIEFLVKNINCLKNNMNYYLFCKFKPIIEECNYQEQTCTKLNEAIHLKAPKVLLLAQLFNTKKLFHSLNYDKAILNTNTGVPPDGTSGIGIDDEPETANKTTIVIIILIAILSLLGLILFAFFIDKFKKCYILNSQLEQQQHRQEQEAQQRQVLNYNNLNSETSKKPYLNGNGNLTMLHHHTHSTDESLDDTEQQQETLLNGGGGGHKKQIYFLKNNKIKYKSAVKS